MKIDKITINEFGALRGVSFSPKDGINIFEGRNESGKSTVVAFIRFMLYGLPKKLPSEIVSERDRILNWETLSASGSMEITVPDGKYRIERLCSAKNQKGIAEECRIIDLSTGSEVFEGIVPGKKFLGITADVYDSTSCVRQLECSTVDGECVRSSIENLLLSADEKIDTKKAQTKLENLRKALLHKSQKGGRIFELEAEKILIEEKLAKAMETADVMIAKENVAANLIELEKESAKGQRDKEQEARIYEACIVLDRFDKLHAEENKSYELQERLSTLANERGYFNTLPDRAILDELDSSEHSLSVLAEKLSIAKAELTTAEASPTGDRKLAKIHEKIVDDGGVTALIKRIKKLSSKRKLTSFTATALYVLGALLTLLGGGAFALPFVMKNASQILDRIIILSSESIRSYLFLGVGILGIVLLAFAISSSVKAKRLDKKKISILNVYGLSSKSVTVEAFRSHATVCEENHKLCEKYDELCSIANAKLTEASDAYNESLQAAISLLERIDTKTFGDSFDQISELLAKRRAELTELCTEKEAIEFEIKAHQNAALAVQLTLRDYDENKLRGDVGVHADIAKILANTDISEVKRAQDFYKNQYAAAMQKRIETEKELIALKTTAIEPAKLKSKLEEINSELKTLRFNYDALVMAIEAIDTASDNIRRNVTPSIRKRAGELMGMLTSGKYKDIGLSSELAISAEIEGNTRSIDALSKGTRDAAYIALRMSLVELICGENPPPFIFDEGFSLLDDVRTKNMLAMLLAYTQFGGQCILFTCHKRETEILRTLGDFTHFVL